MMNVSESLFWGANRLTEGACPIQVATGTLFSLRSVKWTDNDVNRIRPLSPCIDAAFVSPKRSSL